MTKDKQDSSESRIITDGEKSGWINIESRRKTLEMFVFCDRALLTNEAFDLFSHKKNLFENEHVIFPLRSRPSSATLASWYLGETAKTWKPLILQGLLSQGKFVKESDFDKAIEEHEEKVRLAGNSRFGFQPPNDPTKQLFQFIDSYAPESGSLLEAIGLEAARLDEENHAYRLNKTPIFGDIPVTNLPRIKWVSYPEDRDVETTKAKDASEVVGYYFKFTCQLLSPSPSDLRQAIEIKENKLINEWRLKMRSWIDQMATGKLTEADIKREIKEANDYINGAGYAKKVIPNWTLLLTLPAGIAAQFVPGLQPLGLIGIGVGVVQLHSWLAETAVKSSDREKYRWLMISNTK